VPEATIHKHSEPAPGEDDVGTYPLALDEYPEVLPETQAFSMKRRPERDLRACVPTSVRPHCRRRVRG
jgi:hypothetical protein